MTKHHPHLGEMLRTTVFLLFNLGVTEAAERLGLSRTTLSRVINGHRPISADLAPRLERARANAARFWMNLQTNYELWQAEERKRPAMRPLRGT